MKKNNQYNKVTSTKTPVRASSKHSIIDSDQTYGLSKTNESFKQKTKWMSGSKTESSTIGFNSTTNNTTKYSKEFLENDFRSSKYIPSGNQSTITQSSFYK